MADKYSEAVEVLRLKRDIARANEDAAHQAAKTATAVLRALNEALWDAEAVEDKAARARKEAEEAVPL